MSRIKTVAQYWFRIADCIVVDEHCLLSSRFVGGFYHRQVLSMAFELMAEEILG